MKSDTIDASDENPRSIKAWGVEPEDFNITNVENNPDDNGSGGSRRNVITAVFWLAVIASAILILVAVFNSDSIIPLYVIVFSLIGGLMYLFASTASEWATTKEKLKKLEDDGTELKKFNNKNFYDKLDDFDILRKVLRVLAAPLMAIGIYLLFDLIFVDFGTTTVPLNISENSSILEIVNAIETSGDSEKITLMKAGISFLAGAFVKQFLDLIQALAEGIGKKR